MASYRNKIDFLHREGIEVQNMIGCPKPKKHQYYCLSEFCNAAKNDKDRKVYREALDMIQQRPDFNCLLIHYKVLLKDPIASKMRELLKMTDRSWLVCINFDGCMDTTDEELRDSLFMLQDVIFLNIASAPCGGTAGVLRILECLPPFTKLQHLELGEWQFEVNQIESLVSHPFAPQINGIQLCCDKSFVPSPSEPLLSLPATQRIYSLTVHLQSFSVEFATSFAKTITTMSHLEKLSTMLPCWKDKEYLEPLNILLNWFASPRCHLTDLGLDWEDPEYLPMILAVIPKMSALSHLYLQTWDVHDFLDALMPVILETPHVDSIALETYNHFDKKAFETILEFQLSNRPRLFAVQLLFRSNPEFRPGSETIHHVSNVYKTLQNFHNSKRRASFPLSAWTMVLDRLGSAFDCPSADAHPVGVEARFSVLQELLGDPNRLLQEKKTPCDESKNRSTAQPKSFHDSFAKRQRKC